MCRKAGKGPRPRASMPNPEGRKLRSPLTMGRTVRAEGRVVEFRVEKAGIGPLSASGKPSVRAEKAG